MEKLKPVRYANHRPMLIAGLRRYYPFSEAPGGIPAQWQEAHALGRLPGQVGATAYGVSCGADANGFQYMCGMEVESLEALPAELARVRILPQTYAVFVHRGHVSEIGGTWDRILNEWLPNAPCESAHKPDFEVYDKCYDAGTGTGEVEIWISITRTGDQPA